VTDLEIKSMSFTTVVFQPRIYRLHQHVPLKSRVWQQQIVLTSAALYVSFGQGSSLLWTHTLRPFYSRAIALTQEGRSLVNDVCECVRD